MRIVLVDSSRTILKGVARMLEARGHGMRLFVDGAQALACLKSDAAVDCLITSTEPATLSGLALCREARVLAGQRPLHIILMSSTEDRGKRIEALDGGADEFMSKPPEPEELYARLRAAERLLGLQRNLISLAMTDALTGVLNRRAFFLSAEKACADLGNAGTLSAVMLDIDHFKRINDEYGHGQGDQVIREIALTAAGENGVVGRMGGEEFALLLAGCPLSAAVALAERVRLKVAALRFETDGRPLHVTCSFGVAEWQCGDTIDTLLRRADVALYAAKTAGRNRVVAHDAAAADADADDLMPRRTTRAHAR